MTETVDARATSAPDTVPAAPSGRTARRRNRRRSQNLGIQIFLVVLLITLWQALSGRVIDSFFISTPTAVWQTWWGWLIDGTLWYNASSTFYSALLGFAVGGVIAVVLGYLLGGSPRLAEITEPFITSVYSLPKLALVPLLVLWFGIGRELQVVIAALVVFFLMFYNTYFGVREVNRELVDAIKILGGSRRDIALKVRLPSALVWVVAGLKISIPQALIGVVVAEILASNRGLGYLVSINAGQFNAAGTFAALATLAIIGVALDRVVGRLTRRALIWKASGER
ncbi:ABC transporter permease [Dactylosporangium sp. NPDC000555]|uniref:ABC transporter permease n=1 Tax=Dactylosporangium sp. NPDC000555 TaxID=3154260 RepID=UPI003321E4EA